MVLSVDPFRKFDRLPARMIPAARSAARTPLAMPINQAET